MIINESQPPPSNFQDILIIDDDRTFYEPLSFYLNEIGYNCDTAHTFAQGTTKASKKDYCIILLDIFLPDISGLAGITQLKALPSSPEIIIITGQGNAHSAEIALTNGAWDYLEKPVCYNNLKLLLSRATAFRKQKLKLNNHQLLSRDSIIGNSPKLMECFEVVAKAANTSESILISGETGTGKEIMAHTVHLNSPRNNGNFVTVDCTNIPNNLMETILFGHTKGAFTGAESNQEGLVKQADKGTLFFDEIGDLPLPVQKSLLGVLQRKEFRPLGSKITLTSDFRVVSATNRNLQKMVKQGLFRKDLYYRLAAFPLQVPPLRDRLDDLKLLVQHYLDRICEEKMISTKGISRDLVECMKQYDWPGNVRELINILHAAIANATKEPILYPQHLPLDLRVELLKNSLKDGKQDNGKVRHVNLGINTDSFPTLEAFRHAAESKYLEELNLAAEKQSRKSWELAGISRSSWYNLMEKHGKKNTRPGKPASTSANQKGKLR